MRVTSLFRVQKRGNEAFYNESQIANQDNLSAISINLPKEIPKLQVCTIKYLNVWLGKMCPYEVVSTNEFTILVEDHLVDKAFSVVKGLKS